jgi:hypothetical protein
MSIIHLKRLIIIAVIASLSFINSFAQERNYIALSSAVFDVLQQSAPSFETRVEFRLGKLKFFAHPFSGLMVNSEGAMHIYLGLYYDIPLTKHIFITPSFAPGIYAKNSSKDLKYALEFRSQVEFAFKFINGARIGLSFSHVSNAGLGVENPGVESLAITYVIPI